MTPNFTASNGDTIETRPDGWLVVKDSHHTEWVSPLTAGTLREYFQHERDEQLGRWRDPEAPDMVVYPESEANGVAVFNEQRLGLVYYFDRGEAAGKTGSYPNTARRYFAAHPEPKPWHDAMPGEAWVLTIDGTEHLAQTITGRIAIYPHDADPEFFIPTLIPANTIGDIWEHTWSPSDHRITAGRRIWPTESDDE